MNYYSPLGALINDLYVEREIWRVLREKWPQLNERTKIGRTDQRVIYIAEFQPMAANWNGMIPKRVWKRGAVGYFYRILGALFNEPEWVKRYGETTIQVPDLSVPAPKQREVRLERFGVTMRYSGKDYVPHYPGFADETFIIDCGYDAPTDTLYVRKT